MANIIIPDLYPSDSKSSFLDDLSNVDCLSVYGGYTSQDYAFSQFIQFTTKILEFLVVIYAIQSITSLVKSFSLRNGSFQSLSSFSQKL